MPSPVGRALVVALLVATGWYLVVRLSAEAVARKTAESDRLAYRLRWLRRFGYALGGTSVVLLAAGSGSTGPPLHLASEAWRTRPLETLLALAGTTLVPVGFTLLAVRLATLPHRRRARGLDLRHSDIAHWFGTRYAVVAIALVVASAIVLLTPPGLVRLAVVVLAYVVAVVGLPFAFVFLTRARRPTDAERDGVEIPEGVTLRVPDDRTRLGIASAAGILPGARYVFVAESVFESLSPAEVNAVVAHEVAHHRRGHVALRAALAGVAPLVGIAILDFGLPVGPFTFGLFAVVATLLGAGISRHCEYAADATAASRVSASAMAGALTRLAQAHLILVGPGAFAGSFRTHPPIARRLARLERLQSVESSHSSVAG